MRSLQVLFMSVKCKQYWKQRVSDVSMVSRSSMVRTLLLYAQTVICHMWSHAPRNSVPERSKTTGIEWKISYGQMRNVARLAKLASNKPSGSTVERLWWGSVCYRGKEHGGWGIDRHWLSSGSKKYQKLLSILSYWSLAVKNIERQSMWAVTHQLVPLIVLSQCQLPVDHLELSSGYLRFKFGISTML